MLVASRKLEIVELKVNEKNFREKVFQIAQEADGLVAIYFKSEVMHKISQKGLCKNYHNGYTADNGTCMETTEGAMLMNKIAYTVFPFDLLEDHVGVESIITALYDKRGVVKYKLPLKEEVIKKVYILEYDG